MWSNNISWPSVTDNNTWECIGLPEASNLAETVFQDASIHAEELYRNAPEMKVKLSEEDSSRIDMMAEDDYRNARMPSEDVGSSAYWHIPISDLSDSDQMSVVDHVEHDDELKDLFTSCWMTEDEHHVWTFPCSELM